MVEVRRRRATAYELDVDVQRAGAHVPQEPTEAVDAIERRVGLENDLRTDRREARERAGGGARVALAARLGRVHLEEPHALAALDDERVAVDDPRDAAGLLRDSEGRLGAARERDERDERGREPEPTAVDQEARSAPTEVTIPGAANIAARV